MICTSAMPAKQRVASVRSMHVRFAIWAKALRGGKKV
jgi:hypothetical protein